jgi:predicted nucleic acid-binding protein
LSIYADSSFVVSLYLPDEHTPKVERLMRENPQLFLTPLHRAEWAHAIAFQIFQRRISAAESDGLYKLFEKDRKAGAWFEAAVPETAFDLAVDLARRHASEIACRTLDTLHVAAALELHADDFWTFDRRQANLAKAVGLKA